MYASKAASSTTGKRQLLPTLFLLRHTRPVIRAKGGSQQPVLVAQVHDRIVCPAISHCHWLIDLRTVDDDHIPFNPRVGRMELSVLAGNGEALELVSLHGQPLAGVRELQDDLVP